MKETWSFKLLKSFASKVSPQSEGVAEKSNSFLSHSLRHQSDITVIGITVSDLSTWRTFWTKTFSLKVVVLSFLFILKSRLKRPVSEMRLDRNGDTKETKKGIFSKIVCRRKDVFIKKTRESRAAQMEIADLRFSNVEFVEWVDHIWTLKKQKLSRGKSKFDHFLIDRLIKVLCSRLWISNWESQFHENEPHSNCSQTN